MRGDFSSWDNDRNNNFAGVLHQQGRVLLDADWNDQTRITNDWQDTAARDAIGPGVVAVPIDDRHAFEVDQVEIVGGKLQATLTEGHAWVDGLLIHLENTRRFQVLDSSTRGLATGSYAVVLEVWREEVNGFQELKTLIEPALGGPDTTERVYTAMALRLQAGAGCEQLRQQLRKRVRTQGRLTVSLNPTTESNADCPIVKGGGYTGFEHHLYRIEIAKTNRSQAMFKWSQFNGGLVGRGKRGEVDGRLCITITANMQAIQSSGLDSFYLEIIEMDTDTSIVGMGHWRVSYGAQVALDGDRLVIQEHGTYYEEAGTFTGNVFFRLWDGIEDVNRFERTKAFRDGIRLKFDSNVSGGISHHSAAYYPGDYWTFSVRAGQSNARSLLRNKQAYGIEYHRAPLAILHWKGNSLSKTIEDCRRLFRPLTNQKACCSFLVGNGKTSHGDFDSIQEAIDHLPVTGGDITLLPGIHQTNAVIEAAINVTIRGCGLRTVVIPVQGDEAADRIDLPIFQIKNCGYIRLENIVMASWNGTAVQLEAAKFGALQRVTIEDTHIFAFKHAVHADRGSHIHIRNNIIRMFDKAKAGGEAAIYLLAMDSLIEGNNIGVLPIPAVQEAAGAGDIEPDDIDCFPLFTLLSTRIPDFLSAALRFPLDPWLLDPFRAQGGIQIGSGSERIKVLQNRIFGGAGNGITLGSDIDFQDEGTDTLLPHVIEDIPYPTVNLRVKCNQETETPTINLLFKKDSSTNIISAEANGSNLSRNFGFSESCQVFLLDPGYQITQIDRDPFGDIGDCEYIIHVDRAESEDFPDILAFIHDVEIERNEIIKTGLSGIGTPQRNLVELFAILQSKDPWSHPLALALIKKYGSAAILLGKIALQFGVLSGFAVNLTIRNNTIVRCLQSTALSLPAWPRGEGGVSLGFCENLTIQDNRIEDNGISHAQPVSGVFISYAGQVEISRNHILNNGPLDTAAIASLQLPQPGIRGGIILRQATSITKLQSTSASIFSKKSIAASLQAISNISGYAVRIHDNIVRQPVGQALRISSIGPVSVANNRFNVDFSALSKWDKLTGMVLIQNLGMSPSTRNLVDKDSADKSSQKMATLSNINVLPETSLLRRDTIFCDNQMRLGTAVESKTALFIHSADALSYSNNWSDIVAELSDLVQGSPQILLAHAVLWAQVVSAQGNQHAEPLLKSNSASGRFSLVTHGSILNTTVNNQGVHCIVLSDSGKKVGTGNLSALFGTGQCDEISNITEKLIRESLGI
ncbi:MAG: right-handed parallel beta-helix repeat-containing protein [Proteobacteria bacterium]|nr:right-handed parallel beta-helix repeat-containing protein [Pseudomonadota bacterium]